MHSKILAKPFIIITMIYSLTGKTTEIGENFFVLEVGGVGFKVFANHETLRKLTSLNSEMKIFCFLYVREGALELYGFLEEGALKLFEMLNSVAGIGPKTALSILDLGKVENIMAAILEKRAELLTRASGIGRKTAERVILELQNRIKLPESKTLTKAMDVNFEVEEALVGLGYLRSHVKQVLVEMDPKLKTLEERLRQALKELGRSKA